MSSQSLEINIESTDRRERILLVALKQFAELGVDGASIRSIAKEAGVSPALLWRHYQNKPGLVAAVDAYVEQTLLDNLANLELEDMQSWLQTYLPPQILHYLKRGLVEPTDASMNLWQKIYDTSLQYNRDAAKADVYPPETDMHQLTLHVLMHVMLTPLFEPLLRHMSPDGTVGPEAYKAQVQFEYALWRNSIVNKKTSGEDKQ